MLNIELFTKVKELRIINEYCEKILFDAICEGKVKKTHIKLIMENSKKQKCEFDKIGDCLLKLSVPLTLKNDELLLYDECVQEDSRKPISKDSIMELLKKIKDLKNMNEENENILFEAVFDDQVKNEYVKLIMDNSKKQKQEFDKFEIYLLRFPGPIIESHMPLSYKINALEKVEKDNLKYSFLQLNAPKEDIQIIKTSIFYKLLTLCEDYIDIKECDLSFLRNIGHDDEEFKLQITSPKLRLTDGFKYIPEKEVTYMFSHDVNNLPNQGQGSKIGNFNDFLELFNGMKEPLKKNDLIYIPSGKFKLGFIIPGDKFKLGFISKEKNSSIKFIFNLTMVKSGDNLMVKCSPELTYDYGNFERFIDYMNGKKNICSASLKINTCSIDENFVRCGLENNDITRTLLNSGFKLIYSNTIVQNKNNDHFEIKGKVFINDYKVLLVRKDPRSNQHFKFTTFIPLF